MIAELIDTASGEHVCLTGFDEGSESAGAAG